MFTLLHSSMDKELFEKHVCNHSSHYEKYDGGVRPTYRLKLKYPYPFSVSYVCSLHSSTNQELFEKHVCNHRSHNEKYDGGTRPTYRLKLKSIALAVIELR